MPDRATFGLLVLLWTGFGTALHAQTTPDTLRLDAVIQQALKENFQAQIARNDAALVRNNRTLGNAGFLPDVNVTGGYNQTRSSIEQERAGGSTLDTTGVESNQWSGGAELRWRLFDGLGRVATYNRLGAERDQQEAITREQVEAVLADVIDAYYDVARQQQQRAVFREAVAISQERLGIAQMRRDVGTGSDLDVRQARVDLNADSAAVLQQEIVLETARATLFRLLGETEPPSTVAVSTQTAVDRTLTFDGLLQTARTQSPALQQAEDALRVAEAETREIRADYVPDLDATVGYGYSRFEGGTGFLLTSETLDLTYGLSLSFTLFDGLNRTRRRQNAQIRAQNAELRIQDVETRLRSELQSAFAGYRNRLRIVALERENLLIAASNVDLALERFRLGTITSVELRDVQEQRIQAESRLLTAQFDAKRAETELLRLSGQLLRHVQRP